MRKLTKYALTEGTQLRGKADGGWYEVAKSRQLDRWRLRPLAGGEILELRLRALNELFEKA